jgi:DNA-binding MarR family transcriptional regulator
MTPVEFMKPKRISKPGLPRYKHMLAMISNPTESNMQRYFKVSAPAVHQWVLTLEKRGLIERTPGQARTIRVSLTLEAQPGLA